MAIKQTTPNSEIERALAVMTERRKRVLARKLHEAGEKVVNAARAANGENRGTYTDRTGNLRSSIGYVVVVDGKVYYGNGASFTVVKDGEEGAKDGREFIKRIAQEFTGCIALVVVAGMKYASYVQKRGFDVTISAEHVANSILFKLGFPMVKRIKQ